MCVQVCVCEGFGCWHLHACRKPEMGASWIFRAWREDTGDVDAGLLASILTMEHHCCSRLSPGSSSVMGIFKWVTSTFPFNTQRVEV